jgi:hypothetical protein
METVDEFWVPRSHERADIAVIDRLLTGFEIKTERDTLKRLPRQIGAYGRVFDRCTVVVAAKHSEAAQEMLPAWWGVVEISLANEISFVETRSALPNPAVDPETLVRLLWRAEVAAALVALGSELVPKATRSTMWTQLLHATDIEGLRAVVRRSLLGRAARPKVSPFTRPALVSEADR